MYGFHLNLIQAVDRLRYLEQSGFIRRFPSGTIPASFYCLTPQGRMAVHNFNISAYVDPFHPCHYQLIYQQHHRAIIKVFLGLKRLLGDDFLYWVSESHLKAEGAYRKVKRILDGELHLRIHRTFYQANNQSKPVPAWHLDPVSEDWSCGVEVELSLKSPERYGKQFRYLARQIYTEFNHEQHYPMFLFLYSTKTIRDKLVHQIKEGGHNFGECIFYFAQIDQFTSGLADAPVERWVGTSNRTTIAKEMKKVSVFVCDGSGHRQPCGDRPAAGKLVRVRPRPLASWLSRHA